MAAALHQLGAPTRDGARRRLGTYARHRVVLDDGAMTTVHVATYPIATTEVRVALVRGRRLVEHCAMKGIGDAVVGGFFTRPEGAPLGEVRTRGVRRSATPFDAPWDGIRACVHVAGGVARIARRDALPAMPRGDLLQAGPLLVADGVEAFDPSRDPEGFSAGARQFDSDITVGRHPRAAIGIAADAIVAVACDGRSRHDAGLTLSELAGVLSGLGARDAMNLDGGGSTSLVAAGRLRNRPRAGVNRPESGGRPVATALVFLPKA